MQVSVRKKWIFRDRKHDVHIRLIELPLFCMPTHNSNYAIDIQKKNFLMQKWYRYKSVRKVYRMEFIHSLRSVIGVVEWIQTHTHTHINNFFLSFFYPFNLTDINYKSKWHPLQQDTFFLKLPVGRWLLVMLSLTLAVMLFVCNSCWSSVYGRGVLNSMSIWPSWFKLNYFDL